MTNREIMKKYILSNVVPSFLENGFTGNFPHYRKNDPNGIEPITFQTKWDTNTRYRLKGMYDGWFYYNDLYAKRIMGFGKDCLEVSEKQKVDFAVPNGYKLVQEFNGETAKNICTKVDLQMKKAYKWLEKFKKSHK